MRKAIIYSMYSILLMSCLTTIHAQEHQPEYAVQKPGIAVIARSKGDSVMIRWAPGDPILWRYANKYGYRVLRTKVAEKDSLLLRESQTTQVIAESIRPYSIENIEPLIEKDKYAAIVGQAIYGEDFETSASFDKNPSAVFSKAKELEDRFSFALFSADQSPLAARVHGLWWTDKDVNINDKYLYTVYALLPQGTMDYDTAYTVIAVNDTVALPKPYDLRATFGDKFVELSWNSEYLQKFYTSYFVERSDDNGLNYKATTESPFVNTSDKPDPSAYYYRVDSLPENNKLYFFRVRGISPFGELSPPSDAVSGLGIGKTEFINPIITRNEIINGSKAYIEWEVPDDFSSAIESFEISKSVSSDGPYINIPGLLKGEIRNFTDSLPYKSGYYRVASIDKTGERHYSFPAMVLMPDSIPPDLPVNFSGSVDSSGIVSLVWDENSEYDLAGYRVFRSNYETEGYVKINEEIITQSKFQDTLSLRVLTRQVYYKLAAIDKHYNESELTTALIITRPDTLPPAPPSFRNFAVTDSGIAVSWNNSPSDDVLDHLLYRRKTDKTPWVRINRLNDTTGKFLDKDLEAGTLYHYKITAVDKGGLESGSVNEIQLRSGDSPDFKTMIGLQTSVGKEGKSITIYWSHNSTSIAKYALYRAVDDETPVLIRLIEPHDKSFTDTNVQMSHHYTYRIQSISFTGMKSPLSEAVKVSL